MGDPYPELYLDPPYAAPQQRDVDHGQQQPPFFPDAPNHAFQAAQRDQFNVTWPQATPRQTMQGPQHVGHVNNMARMAPLTDIPNGRAFAPGNRNTNMFLTRPGNMQGGLPRLTEMGPANVQACDARPRVLMQAPLNISKYTGIPATNGHVPFATPPRSMPAAQARVSTPTQAAALSTPVSTPAPTVLSTPTRAAPTTAPLTPSGKGSKSGAGNRRIGGDSDEEMAKRDRQAQSCPVYCTARDVEDVSPAPAYGLQFPIQISTVILNNRVSAMQVRNYWHNQAWEKYKAIRTLHKHTGGGDGDEDDGEGTGDEVDGGKKKRTAKDGFSLEVLQDFEKSEIYQLIDRV